MSLSTARHQVMARITSIENVAPRHFQVVLQAPLIAANARAGQFVHILSREASIPTPLLRRAFSIMRAGNDEIEILFRVEGDGTAQIAAKRLGEHLDVLGPLGEPFDVGLFHVKQQDHTMPLLPVLVGGGVGVPPMVFLAKTLKSFGHSPLMLIGARSAREVLALESFATLNVETRVATDDGSVGHPGRVTALLEGELNEIASKTTVRAVVYACGPLPMLRAVASIAVRFNARCQVSLEENMPCGIGVCNGCVVAMKTQPEPQHEVSTGASLTVTDYERYQRICVAGPALWADEVDWEAV